MLFCASLSAQKKHDYIWPYGFNDGKYQLNFNGDAVELESNLNALPIRSNNAVFCNSDGQLILHTNGCLVARI